MSRRGRRLHRRLDGSRGFGSQLRDHQARPRVPAARPPGAVHVAAAPGCGEWVHGGDECGCGCDDEALSGTRRLARTDGAAAFQSPPRQPCPAPPTPPTAHTPYATRPQSRRAAASPERSPHGLTHRSSAMPSAPTGAASRPRAPRSSPAASPSSRFSLKPIRRGRLLERSASGRAGFDAVATAPPASAAAASPRSHRRIRSTRRGPRTRASR